ncbi:MAG: hypothetical protein IPK15_08215 [Verrucomicrobia bacterium]|nr:hypothetical protein [Verrucomicrobiota bacterium]
MTIRASLLLLLGLFSSTGSVVAAPGQELIADREFRLGFILWEPKPGRHVRYGELTTGAAKPVWGLSQWSSRFPLNAAEAYKSADGSLTCSNLAKLLQFGAGTTNPVLVLAADSSIEYGLPARNAKDPWVHLLVEQEFAESPPLPELAEARFRVEARLARSRNRHRDDYSPDRHAAQFQIFFTVQNRNRQSAGFGDLLWFGVPVYDNRDRFAKEFKARDFGGTAKFIFTPGGETYAKVSAHDGNWITLERDLLPLMREALETAWKRGFLAASKNPADYRIGGMNMGWELPGSFDVEMQVRGLSLKVIPRVNP